MRRIEQILLIASIGESIYASGHGRDNVLTLGIWMDFASPRRKH
jgi:hypothetical protein